MCFGFHVPVLEDLWSSYALAEYSPNVEFVVE